MDKKTYSSLLTGAMAGVFLLTMPSVWYIHLVLSKDTVSPFLSHYMPYVCWTWVLCILAYIFVNKQIAKIENEDTLFIQKQREIAFAIKMKEQEMEDHFARTAKRGEERRAAEERSRLEREKKAAAEQLAAENKRLAAEAACQEVERKKKEKEKELFLKKFGRGFPIFSKRYKSDIISVEIEI